jgi:hypothetical protein
MAAGDTSPPELRTVADVVLRLRAVEDALPRSDGIACFTRLYRQVTEGVRSELAGDTFANPRCFERLDLVFANLFLTTLADDATAVPRAWAPLFEARRRRGIAPLQFALAGMNAHINRDLPIALVQVFAELGLELRDDCPEHADFERVNLLLAKVEERVKDEYLSGWVRALSRLLHRHDRLDDVLAMWKVERARDAAWTNAQTLWAIRDLPELKAQFLETLDRTVGLAARGLLIPTESSIGSLARRLRP